MASSRQTNVKLVACLLDKHQEKCSPATCRWNQQGKRGEDSMWEWLDHIDPHGGTVAPVETPWHMAQKHESGSIAS